MNFIKHAIVTLLIFFVVACLAYWAVALSGRMNIGADSGHWPVTDRMLTTIRENSVARQSRHITPRLPDLVDEMTLFEAVTGFDDMCAACHAPPGGSPTAMSRGLNPPAPDLAKLAGKRTPEEIFWVIKHGIRMSGMPAWGPTHSDAELWPIVALITRFPEFADEDYSNLLNAAREAGVEHHHHNDGHDHDHAPHGEHEYHDHESNEHGREHHHGHHDHDSHEDEDEQEHSHDHTHHH